MIYITLSGIRPGGVLMVNLGGGIAIDCSGNVFITGGTSSYGASGGDVFLLKYNSSGSLLRNTTGGSENDYGYGIALGYLEYSLVTGNTGSFTSNYGDHSNVFLLRYELDIDGDGLSDYDETLTYPTYPTISGTDGDGFIYQNMRKKLE